MSQTIAGAAKPIGDELPLPLGGGSHPGLMRELLRLALPVLAEHALHIVVGLNDTYLANKLPTHQAEAAAAVGNIGYIFWFLGLFAGAIGSGSTAIIAREVGARHRRRANSACGQSMLFAGMVGLGLCVVLFLGAARVADFMGLTGFAHQYALDYLRMLCPAVPFVILMFVANACLRGAGDTLTPAVAFIVVDIVNVIFSWGFTWGLFGLPRMGFNGIAVGTVIAYVAGGVLVVAALLVGRGGIKLHTHRLRPHWRDMQRIIRIGVPSGMTDMINWVANFALIKVINRTPPLNVSAAAHTNAVRIESLSYMTGFAFSIAAATMVGQSLGMRDPRRAAKSAYLAFLLGGGFMTLMGAFFILFPQLPVNVMVDDPQVRDLTARCLHITGFCQMGFAAAIIFGGALRGAGDTLSVMLLTTIAIVLFRFGGVLLVGGYLHKPLPTIWVLLASDLALRGILVYGRFLHGGWKYVRV